MCRWRLECALRLYEQAQVTRERAAELAGVSIYEVMDALRECGAAAQCTLEGLRENLALCNHVGKRARSERGGEV
jgi:predicted HTH domain antitoxin